jgi:integrase
MEPIYVKGIRILRPADYDLFLDQILKDHHKTIFEILFWSGMRYIELQGFYSHPEWYMKESRAIQLLGSEGAQRKVKRTLEDRYITPIPPQLETLLRFFHKGPEPPSLQAWDEDMSRWAAASGFDPKGFSAKTTRKSIESWMIAAGISEMQVCLRQGHDKITSMRYYLGLPFSPEEKEIIKKRLTWCM